MLTLIAAIRRALLARVMRGPKHGGLGALAAAAGIAPKKQPPKSEIRVRIPTRISLLE
jgi:hypothetical protein